MSLDDDGLAVNAAVPQEPTVGPIAMPSIAALYSAGRLGAAPRTKVLPSSSRRRIEPRRWLVDCASTVRTMTSRIGRQRSAVNRELQRLLLPFDDRLVPRGASLGRRVAAGLRMRANLRFLHATSLARVASKGRENRRATSRAGRGPREFSRGYLTPSGVDCMSTPAL